MATKKVGKAAALAARKSVVSVARKKPMPKRGDVVWVDGWSVMGVFDSYDEMARRLVLTWPGHMVLVPLIWPSQYEELLEVEKRDIKILSPEEILEKVDYFMRLRDIEMRNNLTSAVDRFVKGPAFRL